MFCFCQHNFAKQKSLSYILRAKHCREDSEIWAEASLNLISRAKLNWISALTIWQVRNWAGTGKSCHTSFIITTPNNHIPLKLTFATWNSGLISSTACGDPLLLARPTHSLCQSLERQRHLVKASLTFSWTWGPRLLGRWAETSPSFSGFAAKMRQNRAHIFLHHLYTHTHTHACFIVLCGSRSGLRCFLGLVPHWQCWPCCPSPRQTSCHSQREAPPARTLLGLSAFC